MSATGAGYDLSPTTFSPDGRVFQVEYAGKAVEKSGTAIGIRCKDGVVLGVEKTIISKMLVKNSNRRILPVDVHASMAMAGLPADARQLINKGREEAKSYLSFYGTHIPGQVLADRIAGHVHMHTLYWYLRPFGAAVLIGSYDENGPELYMVEPSGVCYRYFGCAIGKNRNGAQTELEKIKYNQITCKDAVYEIARIIYALHDDVKDKPFELEISWISDETKKKHTIVPDALRDDAVKKAIDAKRKAEEESDDEMDTSTGPAKPAEGPKKMDESKKS
jgi:20S proteasome subunit alpha 7